jgi:hypothetical protein
MISLNFLIYEENFISFLSEHEYSATVVEENGGGNETTIHSKSRGQYRPSFLPLDLG